MGRADARVSISAQVSMWVPCLFSPPRQSFGRHFYYTLCFGLSNPLEVNDGKDVVCLEQWRVDINHPLQSHCARQLPTREAQEFSLPNTQRVLCDGRIRHCEKRSDAAICTWYPDGNFRSPRYARDDGIMQRSLRK